MYIYCKFSNLFFVEGKEIQQGAKIQKEVDLDTNIVHKQVLNLFESSIGLKDSKNKERENKGKTQTNKKVNDITLICKA